MSSRPRAPKRYGAKSHVVEVITGLAVPLIAGAYFVRRWLKQRSDKKKAESSAVAKTSSQAPSALSTPSKARRDFKVKRGERSEASAAAYEQRQRQMAAYQAAASASAGQEGEQGEEEEGAQGGVEGGGEDQAAFFKMLQSLGFKVVAPNDGSGKVFLVPPDGQEGGEGDEDMEMIAEGEEGAWVGRRREEGAPSSSRAAPSYEDDDEEYDDAFLDDEGELEFDDEEDDLLDDEEGMMPMNDDEVGRRLLEALERMGREGGGGGTYLDDDDDDDDDDEEDYFDDDEYDGMGRGGGAQGGYLPEGARGGGGPGRDEVLRMMDEMMANLDPGGITPDFDFDVEPGEEGEVEEDE